VSVLGCGLEALEGPLTVFGLAALLAAAALFVRWDR
jgi:hypothetical protein